MSHFGVKILNILWNKHSLYLDLFYFFSIGVCFNLAVAVFMFVPFGYRGSYLLSEVEEQCLRLREGAFLKEIRSIDSFLIIQNIK